MTLQVAVPKLLLEAISASPPAWEWMIRFHPSREKEHLVADRAELAIAGHPGVEFDRPNDLRLYDLLNNCDVHVTECSSCAIEALAFGVQTVILGGSEYGEAGKVRFQPFIEKQLMSAADTAVDAIDAVKSARRIPQTDQRILNLFSDHDAAKAALRRLLRNPGGAHRDLA